MIIIADDDHFRLNISTNEVVAISPCRPQVRRRRGRLRLQRPCAVRCGHFLDGTPRHQRASRVQQQPIWGPTARQSQGLLLFVKYVRSIPGFPLLASFGKSPIQMTSKIPLLGIIFCVRFTIKCGRSSACPGGGGQRLYQVGPWTF